MTTPSRAATFLSVGVFVLAACGPTETSSALPPPAPPLVAFTPQGECAADDAAASYPGAAWQEVDPHSAGWDDDALQRALDVAQRGHWVAGMIIHSGHVVARFGDTAATYDTRSIRKSIMGAVAGQLIQEGRLSLNATLADLNINDNPSLTPRERTATLQHLLQSRSGVYHEAAFMTPGDREGMPARGEHAPGEAYWYNNWGFNALGTIVRNAAGPLGQVVETRIARPLGMQDFSATDVRERFEPVSQHSAYRIWMSTRDRARFGYLYMRHGCWRGQQIVPASWVTESLYPHTDRDDADDFGYVWRSQEALDRLGMTQRWYSSRGNNLQYILLIPEWDVLIVLTTDMDHPGWINVVRRRAGLMPDMDDVSNLLTEVAAARPH